MTETAIDGVKKGKSKEVCGYPISIFFIVVNEFCERFSYYGMRAVLVLYFRYFLQFDDDLATSIYHTFVALCYLTPILGAIIADSWLGKFKTIIYLSIVYAIGQVVMAVSAVNDITDSDRNGTPDSLTFHITMSMLGLLLIALGTGGIKPCVAAFGGDQFQDHQAKQRGTFFSVFYLCINGGSLLSTIITPLLRAQECGIHSQQKCYPLAFGVPAALMVVSLGLFLYHLHHSTFHVPILPVMSPFYQSCPLSTSHVPFLPVMSPFYQSCPLSTSHVPILPVMSPFYQSCPHSTSHVPFLPVMSPFNSSCPLSASHLPFYMPCPGLPAISHNCILVYNDVLLFVPTVVFIAGSGMYHKTKPQGNIMLAVCKCIGFAISNRFKHRSSVHPKRTHWMDWAEERYDKLLIAQIKMVLKVLFLYIPLPMFWTLFDQKGSRWTLQATTMDGNFGIAILQPDQMQTVNPIFILTLVPIMDKIVYPLIKKCGLNFTPLRRMTVGMFLAAMAFVAAAVVQIQIDKTLPSFPSASQSQLKLLNMGSNTLMVKLSNNYSIELQAAQATENYITFEEESIKVSLPNSTISRTVVLPKEKRQTLLIPSNVSASWEVTDDLMKKPEQGANGVRFVNGLAGTVNVSAGAHSFGSIGSSQASNYSFLSNGKATFTITNGVNTCEYSREFGFGSSYTLLIPSNFMWGPTCWEFILAVEDIKPNSFHMGWQIPQYFLITCGEVVFSVTGLEFSYSQAPSNMKAVLQAGWLFTVAVGNFIVLIVAEIAQIEEQWAEFFLFASLLVAVCIIFSIMAHFYTYTDPTAIEAQFRDKSDNESHQERLEMEKKHSIDHHDENDEQKQTKM
ncbi:solute carrier family 15 member 1 isoform X1 [Esox lucius]|uniref:Solute carrier family 15 member 1a n=1 Tax=Esox lucius TaxID=8010 RepID=A0A3P8Z9J7_ESOLU|nr:solute carrier family 15 member 1 isoform X1 [Esox lucius]